MNSINITGLPLSLKLIWATEDHFRILKCNISSSFANYTLKQGFNFGHPLDLHKFTVKILLGDTEILQYSISY